MAVCGEAACGEAVCGAAGTFGRVGLWLVVVLAVVAGLSGCGSSEESKSQQTNKKLQKKEKAQRPDFEIREVRSLPSTELAIVGSYKPGHWGTANVDVVANRYDYQASLEINPKVSIRTMPFEILGRKPISLAKEQPKVVETLFYVPRQYLERPVSSELLTRSIPLQASLTSRRGSRLPYSLTLKLKPLSDFQFFFVVLAKEPSRYRYLEVLPAFDARWPGSVPGEQNKPNYPGRYYKLVLPLPPGSVTTTGQPVTEFPLPSRSLCWTAIAYVIWDDLDPDALTSAQQRALVDWLHWGGQLIISGPDSLPKLRNSFLEDYLPADADGSVTFAGQDFLALQADRWMTSRDLEAFSGKGWSGERLKLRPNARQLVPSSTTTPPLVVDKQVGRGRVVVTAIRLTQPDLPRWMLTDDSFLNAGLLGRSRREYRRSSQSGFDELSFRWVAPPAVAGNQVQHQLSAEIARFAPEHVSRLWYFSRDTDPDKRRPAWLQDQVDQANLRDDPRSLQFERVASMEFKAPKAPQAAWDDFNGVAGESREELKDLDIQVPERLFVAKVLLIYLLVLVPANWLIFRLIGKVEWAWIAAPVITIAYTIFVIYTAEVSLGFARHRTEVAILEIQPGYQRAHLTRYLSLYASLATTYDLTMQDPSSLVRPFPDGSNPTGQWQTNLELVQDESLRLEGLSVDSNSQRLVHAEQMFDLGGSISLSPNGPDLYELTNQTDWDLRGAEFHTGTGYLPLGDIAAGDSVPIPLQELRPLTSDSLSSTQRASGGRPDRQPPDAQQNAAEVTDLEPERPQPSQTNRTARDRLEKLWRQAQKVPQNRDHWRLIAWNDKPLPGVQVDPPLEIRQQSTLIVVHLRYPETKPQADRVPLRRFPELLNIQAWQDALQRSQKQPDPQPPQTNPQPGSQGPRESLQNAPANRLRNSSG